MNSEILEEVLDHPIFDQYNEELNATQINMAYYDAMRRNARSVQTAAYAQARINECKEKLAAIDAQIEEAVYTLAEEYELNEGIAGSLLKAGGRALAAGARRVGGAIAGTVARPLAASAERSAGRALVQKGTAAGSQVIGGMAGRVAGAAASVGKRAAMQPGNLARRAAAVGTVQGAKIGGAVGGLVAGGLGYAAGRATGGQGGTTPPAGGPPAGGPPAPAGPKPGTPVTTDPTEGPSGYRYPSSNKKFSDEVTDAAYSNKLVGSGKSPDKIYPGQKLKIGGADVTVQKGDTLSGLVQKSRIAKKAGQAGRTGTTADGSAGMSQQADF